jgi:hypothetical protein
LLYVSGQGLDYLLAYDVDNLERPPNRSPVAVRKPESFRLNESAQELYVYNRRSHELLSLDTKTLAHKRTVAGLNLFSGDVTVGYSPGSDAIVIASEGRYWSAVEKPYPADKYGIAVIHNQRGEVAYTVRECEGICAPGQIQVHPRESLVYMAFPKKVIAYDLEQRRVVATAPEMNWWVDGLAMTSDGAELLVGAPLHGSVLRFDAHSLQLKGEIDTVLGVRALAVDRDRNLLLTASLATTMVDVIDLATYRRLARYRAGPWLRAIALDTEQGVAYISSISGLFRIDYAASLGKP